MADTVEQQDIRGLDIDKTVKGFALGEYIFKSACTVSPLSGDSVRWYQETAADLTATAPSKIANISPLSSFANLEVSWTRKTSYVKKYAAECFISMEDMKSSDVDVAARTLLRLTRAVVKQVDTDIWNVMTEDQSAVDINSTAATGTWDAGSGQDIIKDLLVAKRKIQVADYDAEGAILFVSPLDYQSMVTWLISTKGASIPGFSSAMAEGKIVNNILGLQVKVSNNVTADYAAVVVPQKACTFKQYTDTTAKLIEDAGVGTKFRVWELGIALLTDPKAVSLITNTQA